MSYIHNCLSTICSCCLCSFPVTLRNYRNVPQQASSTARKSSYSGVILEVRAAQNLKCQLSGALKLTKWDTSVLVLNQSSISSHLFPSLPITSPSHHLQMPVWVKAEEPMNPQHGKFYLKPIPSSH